MNKFLFSTFFIFSISLLNVFFYSSEIKADHKIEYEMVESFKNFAFSAEENKGKTVRVIAAVGMSKNPSNRYGVICTPEVFLSKMCEGAAFRVRFKLPDFRKFYEFCEGHYVNSKGPSGLDHHYCGVFDLQARISHTGSFGITVEKLKVLIPGNH